MINRHEDVYNAGKLLNHLYVKIDDILSAQFSCPSYFGEL